MDDTLQNRFLLGFLALGLLFTAFAVINSKHESRKAFVTLQKLLNEKDDLDIYWGRLQLEQGAFTAHGRIEQMAETDLNMQQPNEVKIIVVQP